MWLYGHWPQYPILGMRRALWEQVLYSPGGADIRQKEEVESWWGWGVPIAERCRGCGPWYTDDLYTAIPHHVSQSAPHHSMTGARQCWDPGLYVEPLPCIPKQGLPISWGTSQQLIPAISASRRSTNIFILHLCLPTFHTCLSINTFLVWSFLQSSTKFSIGLKGRICLKQDAYRYICYVMICYVYVTLSYKASFHRLPELVFWDYAHLIIKVTTKHTKI